MIYLGRKGGIKRQSWKEWFLFKVTFQQKHHWGDGLLIPFFYVKYMEDSSDTDWYIFAPLFPFTMLKRALCRGIKIGKIRIYWNVPSWETIKDWQFYKEMSGWGTGRKNRINGDHSPTTGAFFINKSEELIYAVCLPPLIIKYYRHGSSQ